MRRFTIVTIVLTSVVSFLVGVILTGGGVATAPVVSPPAAAVRSAREVTAAAPPPVVNFADVAERINPTVVNIDAASRGRRGDGARDGEDRSGELPREFDLPHQGSGSGFIIDRTGLILTNYHVIEDADRITVTLADGRTFRGTVVGADPAIDVAVVRVPGVSHLPEAPLGDSDMLRVGEWVCAIGNPLGYVHSVTVGVVSFIGRKLFDASLDDYIQTDAAINFGNSGGPLIDAHGDVIGINAAISSRASNIGFAVPINQAIAVLPQLETRGTVSRGFIGVELTDVTPDLQRSLGLTVSRGALVQDVTPDSPAERAGLRLYDVIVQVDGRDIWTNDELIREISGRQPGTLARLSLVRDGHRDSTTVKLAERPPRDPGERGLALPGGRRVGPEPGDDTPPFGLTVRPLDAGFVHRLEIPDSVQGVVVARVDPVGAAFVPAIRRGCVIMEIDRHPIRSVADYQRSIGAARPGEALAFYVYDPSVDQRILLTASMDASR
ncbi:MAG TPA: trypsin-like peptidase domain-containing protein [Vicinamibacterales bacterium]|nr:trypsin-like peptidase domain-containing protein [Vicinamibacterales bacterium]